MQVFRIALLLLAAASSSPAAITNIGPWTPLFKGIEHAFARVEATNDDEKFQAIHCLRIDLTDPDISLFTTPRCTNCTRDTANQHTSHFLESYGVQVAVNGTFSSPSDGTLGNPADVEGLAISQGTLVSTQQVDDRALVALLFTTNNAATFIPTNWPPADIAGIYTAISGDVALLTDGINTAGDDDSEDPRTAVGISEDKRYLFLMTADGRNGGWADGMTVFEEADWIARFGAYNALNVDGGGSTTMVMADCKGNADRLNIPSYVLGNGRERRTGHNIGVYAPPLPSMLKDLNTIPESTTALVTWKTDFDATAQVEYGLTTNYGSITPLDSGLRKDHFVTLTNLIAGTNYFFRATSSDGTTNFSAACYLSTTTVVARTLIFDVDKAWKYTTNSQDGIDWKAPGFDDSGWLGPSNGLFYINTANTGGPRNTVLPPGGSGPVLRTYYFRTHFDFSGPTNELSLVLSNYIDDGAVFYLNGTEIVRLRMPGGAITSSTAANNRPCGSQGDAICPDVTNVTSVVMTNLVQGDNVLAVEVHNYSSGTPDLAFGAALIANQPGTAIPKVHISLRDDLATMYWNGVGFTLQQSSDLSALENWIDSPGPVITSPTTVTNEGTLFYRLRR